MRRARLPGSIGESYLQDLAPLRVAVDVLAGMEHAQCHAVQQDHEHGRSLKPRGGTRLRRMAACDKRSSRQTNQKVLPAGLRVNVQGKLHLQLPKHAEKKLPPKFILLS